MSVLLDDAGVASPLGVPLVLAHFRRNLLPSFHHQLKVGDESGTSAVVKFSRATRFRDELFLSLRVDQRSRRARRPSSLRLSRCSLNCVSCHASRLRLNARGLLSYRGSRLRCQNCRPQLFPM
jgi:hypothetical protein